VFELEEVFPNNGHAQLEIYEAEDVPNPSGASRVQEETMTAKPSEAAASCCGPEARGKTDPARTARRRRDREPIHAHLG
jgi:hypothetical protein